jgi:hypothetical protein
MNLYDILVKIEKWFVKLNAQTKIYAIILLVIFLMAGFIVYQFHQINSLKSKLIVANQNVSALDDTIRIVKTKSGQEEAVKYALLVKNVSDLQKINADLAKQVKDQQGKVQNITNIGVTAKHDTIKIKTTVVEQKDSTYNISAAYSDSSKGGSISLSEKIKFRLPGDSAQIIFDRLQMNLNITTGLSVVKNKVQSYAECLYPGVKFTTLNSASFDVSSLVKPKSGFWLGCKCFGIGVGVGLLAVPIYKLFTK